MNDLRSKMQRLNRYTVDLTRIEGSGEFKCPKCGIEISPDDKTEKVYTILENRNEGEFLDELVLRCNRCGSQIHLTGFKTPKK
jgi:predicted RNA-binding Zn-ribbon protein involved in translation (DUF1610 family)